MLWFFPLDNLISFQGKKFKAKKEKDQQHVASGLPEPHFTQAYALMHKFQFLLINDFLNLSPKKTISSKKPHFPFLHFNKRLTFLISFSCSEQQLQLTLPHILVSNATPDTSKISKQAPHSEAAHSYQQRVPIVSSQCATGRMSVPDSSLLHMLKPTLGSSFISGCWLQNEGLK